MTHSPTPWEFYHADSGFYSIEVANEVRPFVVATPSDTPEDKANAALIVTAVNNYDKLVDALRELCEAVELAGPVGIRQHKEARSLLTELEKPHDK